MSAVLTSIRQPPVFRSGLIGGTTVAVATLGAVAVYSPRYALFAVIGGALVAVAFWRLAIGVALFAVLTFPQHLPGSLGAGATLAKPLGFVLALAWIASAVSRPASVRLLSRDQPALFWAVTAFVVLAIVSVAWAPNTARVRYDVQRLLLDAVLLLVVYTAASTATALRRIAWAYLAGSALTAAYSVASGGYGRNGRLNALFDPNLFAALLIPAILVAFFVLLTADSRRTRSAAAAVLLLDSIAAVLTQSRGGVVGLAVAFLAAVVVAGRARPRVFAAVLVVVAIGIGYYLTYAPAHLHVSGSLAQQSSGRSDEWRIALRMFANHPLNGVGLGNYVIVEPSYSTLSMNLNFVRFVVRTPLVAHNSFLEVAAELGLVGIVLFVAILSLAARAAGRALAALAQTGSRLEFYARGLLAGAIGMFVAYAFLSAEYEKQLWLVLGLLASVSALSRRPAPADG
ncbi:MAG TPA: O-antigen ligase family protein [Gaiellaceae bacterium]|nr:O-antigen ligase family protein [Gaiellaceae bacterium]